MKYRHILAAMALSVMTAAAAYAAPLEMNFQSAFTPAQRQNADALEPWARSFEEKSGGDMTMHFFYSGGLVEFSALGDAIKSGMVDAGGWIMSDPAKTPYFFLFGLPYLAKDQSHAFRISQRLIAEVPELKKELESVGVLLGNAVAAPSMIVSKDIPVRSPADMKGRRVLCLAGASSDYIEAWGGIPITTTPGDVYVGLQRGMGEMYFVGVAGVRGSHVYEFCKYATPLGISTSTIFPYSINRDLFEKDMTDEQRKMTLELSEGLGQKVVDSFNADVAEAYKTFEEAGCKVLSLTDEEMSAFIKAAQDNVIPSMARKAKNFGIADPEAVIRKYMEIAAAVD
ncbi:MAG: TRAP transporter substrate-binding protein DctP [Mailhella sp.]|nr:TRAP transporter substrate-binding protein DctP [Mailhella sp.]